MAVEKRIGGTREWAVAEIDCCTGCSHGCRYCYARYDSVVRKKIATEAGWHKLRIRPEDVAREFPLYPGTVMFPAHHDIQPDIVDDCIILLERLLAAGNRVLIVSKPHPQCIVKICQRFTKEKERVLFRFSITARDDRILKFWEPGAPRYAERLASLKHCFACGYRTSVSIEPMLDSGNIGLLVGELTPYVNHSIWIGKMNKIEERVVCDSDTMAEELQRLREGQSDERILAIYQKLKSNPLIRWKESIKEVVGLPPAGEPGLDI